MSGQITLSAKANESVLLLSVADNGCGITPEQLPHLFEPFISYKRTGSGLGLSIAERILRAHHGTISVQSNDSGTRFLICLPIL